MLTAQYLSDHAEAAKTGKKSDYEAFGRTIAELILRSAANSPVLENGNSAGVVSLMATIRLEKNQPMLCVSSEVCTPFGCVSAHIGV